MSVRNDTIAAISTPAGKGGIGVVRISGNKSFDVAYAISGIRPEPRRAYYCAFRDDGGAIIDKGILIYFKRPNSFTGEDIAELQGHGGQVVMHELLDQVIKHGARLAKPGEFTERAFLNEKIDFIQAEAVADLINSGSAQAARSAARSLEGEFSCKIKTLQQKTIELRVYVEGSLDFPEEEIDFLKHPQLLKRINNVSSEIDSILVSARNGRKLKEGLRTVIVGQPNTGKSSLLNRLSGSDRAIVTEIAGTTRDVIEDAVLIKGVTINLVDTAGIRNPNDMIEHEGIQRSLRELDNADIAILVAEYSSDQLNGDQLLEGIVPMTDNTIVVHNKIDLHNAEAECKSLNGVKHVCLSAKTGEGMDLLREALMQVSGLNNLGEDVVLARGRHIKALEKTKNHIDEGIRMLDSNGSPELIAEELSLAQQALTEITGGFNAEGLLEEIFSRFCIGK